MIMTKMMEDEIFDADTRERRFKFLALAAPPLHYLSPAGHQMNRRCAGFDAAAGGRISFSGGCRFIVILSPRRICQFLRRLRTPLVMPSESYALRRGRP